MACAVSSLSLLASNKSVLFGILPKPPLFMTINVQVLRDGRRLYSRSLNAENLCKSLKALQKKSNEKILSKQHADTVMGIHIIRLYGGLKYS